SRAMRLGRSCSCTRGRLGRSARGGALRKMMAFPGADVDRDEVLAMPNHHLLPSQSDRWIEADLFVFQDQPVEPQVRKFFDRYEPLYRCVTGDRGVILCCGWLCDLVTEWTGTADQPLPFHSRSAG